MPLLSRRSLPGSLLFLGLVLGSCSKPVPPTVRPVAVRAVAIGPERVTLDVELDVNNPNDVELSVQRVNGVFELQSGIALGTAQAEPRVPLPANASSVVSMKLDVPWQNLPVLAPFALSGADVPYRFRGTATMGGKRLNTDVPFVVEGRLTQAEVLKLGLRGFGG